MTATPHLAEIEVVIRRSLTVHGKPLKDHLEAKNHLSAFQFLRQLVAAQTAFSENILLQLHALILRGIEDEWAGRYRTVPVRLSGLRHIPLNAIKVPDLMAALFAWYGTAPAGHPVEIAADLHLRLAQVHPFIDGNGRVCRLAMNLHLMQRGFPLTIIRAANTQRAAYHALAAADESGRIRRLPRFCRRARLRIPPPLRGGPRMTDPGEPPLPDRGGQARPSPRRRRTTPMTCTSPWPSPARPTHRSFATWSRRAATSLRGLS